MRLLKTEHDDLVEILKTQNLVDSAQFVKRKGWVYVEIGQNSYAFHRKKHLKLVNGSFIEQFQYFVKIYSDTQTVNDWPSVIQHFKDWCKDQP